MKTECFWQLCRATGLSADTIILRAYEYAEERIHKKSVHDTATELFHEDEFHDPVIENFIIDAFAGRVHPLKGERNAT